MVTNAKGSPTVDAKEKEYCNIAVSYTPPRILMDSIRSPDKVLILLMDS
jgi:hypothetical protein